MTELSDSTAGGICWRGVEPEFPVGAAKRATARRSRSAGGSMRARFGWLTRPRRILLALGAVWVLNVFDLGFTVLESTRHRFIEVNPIAAHLLRAPTHLIVAYKAALVVAGSTILLVLRRQRLAELGCWLLLAVYLYVGVRWCFYFGEVIESLADPTATAVAQLG